MGSSKEELVRAIEAARKVLNDSILSRQPYSSIYQNSVELDHLIEQYVAAGF